MTKVEFRKARLLDDGSYDCEINHPQFGWIPFTADPNDVEPHGRAIHAAIVKAQGSAK